MPGVYQKTINRDLIKTGDEADAAFAAGVRSLLRCALDVFLLGEIRDAETARVARAVLESGHSTYTTTHAASALGIFDKYMSPQVGIPAQVLGTPGHVRLNVYQALLPKTCPRCGKAPDDLAQASGLGRAARDAQARYLDRFEQLYGIARERLRLRDPKGCERCIRPELPALNGFAGRTVVAEMLEPDEALCERLLAGDKVGLLRHWRERSNGRYDDPDLSGKTAMEVAVYKAAQGLIDPREIELHFEPFATVAHRQATQRRTRPRSPSASRDPGPDQTLEQCA